MQWSELYSKDNEPSESQIREFVGTSIWEKLDNYLQQEHNVKPQIAYSGCAMDNGVWRGWNVILNLELKALYACGDILRRSRMRTQLY